MPDVALVNVHSAGGVILGLKQTKVKLNGKYLAVVGDSVAGHGKSPHSSPVMVEGSGKVTIQGIPICLNGHKASCGHAAVANDKVHVSG